jgi:hypothetical protein
MRRRVRGQFTDFGCGSAALRYTAQGQLCIRGRANFRTSCPLIQDFLALVVRSVHNLLDNLAYNR